MVSDHVGAMNAKTLSRSQRSCFRLKLVQIQPMRYRLALVLNTLFYPLTFPDVVDSLNSRKFVARSTTTIPPGVRNYVGGTIATKEDVTVDLDPERKIVATESKNVDNLVRIFHEVMQILHEDYGLNVDESTDYVELGASVLIKSKGIAREKIEGLFSDASTFLKLRDVLGFDPVVRSFTIGQKDKPPESKEYVEMVVNYRVTVKDTYYIEAIYRHTAIAEAVRFAKSINSKTEGLVGLMETCCLHLRVKQA